MESRSPGLAIALRILVAILLVVLANIADTVALVYRGHVLLRCAVPILMIAIGLGLYVLLARKVEGRRVDELSGPGRARETLVGVLLGGGLMVLALGVLHLLGVYRVAGLNPVTTMLPILLIAVPPAVFEELVFRGIVLRQIERRWGSTVALWGSALLFGAVHLFNPEATVWAALAIALEAGLLLGAAYLATRRLWLPMGIHFGWNFAQSGIMGVPTSGFSIKGLLQGELTGPAWLSGGGFGTEASLVTAVVCTTAGLAVWRLAWRLGHAQAPTAIGLQRPRPPGPP